MLNPAAAISLGQQHARAGNHAEAERVYRQLIQTSPTNAVAWHNLGMACWIQKRPQEAIEAMNKAIEHRPDYVEAMNNLGAILTAENRIDEAIAAFRRAVKHRPGWIEPLMNIGNMLRNNNRYDEAIEAYAEAVKVDPRSSEAHHFLASALGRQGLQRRSREHFIEALRLKPSDVVVHSSLLFVMSYDPDLSSDVLLNEHTWWDRLHGQGLLPVEPHRNTRDPNRRIRIGYVSPDFRTHPVARFMLPIYEAHDHEKFEIFSYAQMYKFDALSDRFKALSSGWRITYGQSDQKIADMIRADQIDILVDLTGHTGGNRIGVFAWQPAPVQLSYLGYPGTSGLKAIQYRLTDSINDPAGEPSYYTEELVRLPGTWCCYRPPEQAPDVVPAPVLANGFITFGSMQNLMKLNDGVVDLWMQVLRALPTSRLRIYRNTLDAMARQFVTQRFVARGLNPSRLELSNAPEDGTGHLLEYGKLDISLDTQPWTGHATTCESIWMGVPMITLRGTRASGRMSASILNAVGLSECIADTPEDFARIATDFANNPTRLSDLRGRLRDQMRNSVLCDARTFTRQLEGVYRDLWQGWCRSG